VLAAKHKSPGLISQVWGLLFDITVLGLLVRRKAPIGLCANQIPHVFFPRAGVAVYLPIAISRKVDTGLAPGAAAQYALKGASSIATTQAYDSAGTAVHAIGIVRLRRHKTTFGQVPDTATQLPAHQLQTVYSRECLSDAMRCFRAPQVPLRSQ
jgi:hypothetical protein